MCGFYQPPIPSLPSTLSFAGKTIIITGGARGIGYTTSLQLLQHRLSTLILAVRSITRGEAAAASLLRDAEVQRVNPKARIEVVELDLARFESVKGFVGRMEEKLGGQGVDVLLLNAGINLARWEKTVDGFETLVLSYFLLPVLFPFYFPN
jgi:NAD(P)-dependent dehydrogenase (short-subunit alcohol dehydrogenase family)